MVLPVTLAVLQVVPYPGRSAIDSKYKRESNSTYRMKPSRLGENFAYCTVCNIDFSVAGGGVHQVKRHCESKRHTLNMKEATRQPAIHEAFSCHKKHEALKDQVTCAELYFTRFVVEHNLPFAVADHFNSLCKGSC